jgi:hypothetical protein
MFDNESEVLQFLSHCSQLNAAASARHVTNVTKPLEDNIKSRPAEVQAQANAVTQTVQNVAQSSTQNIIVLIQTEKNRTQQHANSQNITRQQAQDCLNQQAQQHAAIANASRKYIRNFILVIIRIGTQNLFNSKFISCLYIFRAPFAQRQEVKIVFYSLWYLHL